ncbi:hypothetical protein CNR22_02605 [Sphingobacteriaceae bacterium]|nr:hypothetical protein CNR22_02605 [Sphingobacteriaceae bacterium]
MFKALAKIILRSRVSQENAIRQKKFIPWDKIENVALIIEKQESLNKSVIDRFIDESKKHVEVFYIETDSKDKTYGDWNCYSKKDKSLWNLPKKEKESELKTKKFDAVINTCSETNLFAIAVFSSLAAYLKCAQNNSFNLPDLIIKKTDAFSLKNYLDETVKYLKMIKV